MKPWSARFFCIRASLQTCNSRGGRRFEAEVTQSLKLPEPSTLKILIGHRTRIRIASGLLSAARARLC
jgi:hypothetical protein